jgi:hypothetical protein
MPKRRLTGRAAAGDETSGRRRSRRFFDAGQRYGLHVNRVLNFVGAARMAI